jgi:hypothetical protein
MLLADPTALQGEISLGNVLTFPADVQTRQAVEKQRVDAIPLGPYPEAPAYSVKDTDVEPRAKTTPQTARRRGKKPAKRGPKGSTCLTWNQVKQIDGFAHLTRKERVPLTMFITYRAPSDVPDAKGKRIISRKIAHLGQDLKRRGQPHVAVTVYEKKSHLHAHHLVHVAPKHKDLILGRDEGEGGDVHVRMADRFAPVYITKQRRWMGPEIENKIRTAGRKRLWEEGASIVGPRFTFTTDARALMTYCGVKQAEPRRMAA